MKRRKKLWLCLIIGMLAVLGGCQKSNQNELDEKTSSETPLESKTPEPKREGTKPFENLKREEIVQIEVTVWPGEYTTMLTEEQMTQLVELFKNLVIYNKTEPLELFGGGERMNIIMKDGTVKVIDNFINYLVIDNIWYEGEEESSESLSEFLWKCIQEKEEE